MKLQLSEVKRFVPFQTLGSTLKSSLLCGCIAEGGAAGGVEVGRSAVSSKKCLIVRLGRAQPDVREGHGMLPAVD